MGWSDCGSDQWGRPIGYSYEALCDEPGCKEEIDRGLSFACGGMHGEDAFSCEKYYCEKHLRNIVDYEGRFYSVCSQCAKDLRLDELWVEDEDEGVFKPVSQ